jgi:XRE family transcriptional regulator, regulator of sulfur utilization
VALTYEEMMQEIRAGWSESDRALSDVARHHFATMRHEVFELGTSLKTRRQELGLSQLDVAHISGVQQAEISRIERDLANPTWNTLRKLAAVLKMDITLRPE